MVIAAGKRRYLLTLDAEVVERFDALCRKRGRHRGHAVEAMMRRSLAQAGKVAPPPRPDPRQVDLEDVLVSPSPADQPADRAGSAAASEDSRPVDRAPAFERDQLPAGRAVRPGRGWPR